MFQIDNSTAVAAIPAPTPAGPQGYFTDGNPATGVSATILPAEFMNMLMMENLNVLAAGEITPAKGQYNQLSLAIAKIVQSGAAGAASETTAGILKLSTNTQVIAGTDDSTAVTPLKLFQKLASYLVQATESAFGWLKIATQAIVSAGVDDTAAVTPKKLAAATQAQVFTAFTAGGTAPAFTLTPTPAISAYVPNQRFQVAFGAAGGATPTLNISAQGAKNLKQYNSAGAKVAAVIASGQTSDLFYDGADLVLLDQLPVNGLVVGSGGWLSYAPAITGPVAGVTGSQLFSGASGATTDGPSAYPNTVGLHMIFANPTYGADIAVSINEAVGNLLFRNLGGPAPSGWRTVWHDGNFTPSTKISGNSCPEAGFAGGDKTVPYMKHSDGSVVVLSRKNTAQLAASGWSKNTDTGEIIQWVEVLIGDFSGTVSKTVTWPFQFPGGFLNAKINFRDISSNVNIQGAYGAASVTGCTIRVDEWSAVIQSASLTAIVEARGF